MRILVLVFVGAAFTACGAGDGVPYGDLQKNRPPKAPSPGYEIRSTVDILRFQQGRRERYDLQDAFQVPAPGSPVVSVEGLPDGATFADGVLEWRPPCHAEAGFYVAGLGATYVLFTLRSSSDPEQFIQRRSLLAVNESKRGQGGVCGDDAP